MIKDQKVKRINVPIPVELLDRIYLEAAKRHQTINQYISESVEQRLRGRDGESDK